MRDQDLDALQLVRRAGSEGLALGEITVSSAIILQMAGFVVVTADADGWQSARITRTGASAAQQRRFG